MKQAGFILLLILISTGMYGQSLYELRVRKKKAAEELEYASKLLEQAQQNEQASLNQLRLINRKISERNKIISALQSEVSILEEFIEDNESAVSMLQNDLKALQKEYAEMIVFAYKNRSANDYLIFLLSSEDFNQAYKRYLYLKQYAQYRKIQASTIGSIKEVLEKKVKDLTVRKEEKDGLLKEMLNEASSLKKEKDEQNLYMQKMQQEQRSLRQKIRQQQKEEQELEREIQRIIAEEARKAREAGKPGFALTPEQKLAGENFVQNKSRLPWPVERGIIVEKFGLHQHPTLSNITIKNNGVDIATEPGSKVRAVFNGEVSRVFAISGGNMAVIVRHGQYLTVYSNLVEVTVKAGDKVSTKQNIGTVYTDLNDGGKTILKFQVWYENQKMDPEDWIVK